MILDYINLAIALLVAITVHEFAHAQAAVWLGDDTPKTTGRLTLNPLAHLDPLGTLFLILFRFGWGKPVLINPRHFRQPVRDEILVAFAGPISNIILAALLGLAIRFTLPLMSVQLAALAQGIVVLNLFLAFFNLIPLPPLDGSKIVQIFISPQTFYQLNRYGFIILIGAMLIGSFAGLSLFDPLIITPANYLFRIFTGIPSL